MSLDETLNINTPENVTFDYDIAGIASRFTAALIDTVLIVILQMVTNLLVLLVLSRFGDGTGIDNLEMLGAWVVGLVGLISFLFLWGYYIFFEMLWNGQTPGKKAIKLRVIRSDGTAITLTESVIRNLVRLVDFLPAFYGIGTVSIFINRQTRRLGDLAAGTLVVHEKNQQVTLKDLAALHAAALAEPAVAAAAAPRRVVPAAPSAADEPTVDGLIVTEERALAENAAGQQADEDAAVETAALQAASFYAVERLDYQDIQLVESFFQRKKELVNADALAGQLLNRLLVKLGADGAGASAQPAEETLRAILAEYRRYRALE